MAHGTRVSTRSHGQLCVYRFRWFDSSRLSQNLMSRISIPASAPPIKGPMIGTGA